MKRKVLLMCFCVVLGSNLIFNYSFAQNQENQILTKENTQLLEINSANGFESQEKTQSPVYAPLGNSSQQLTQTQNNENNNVSEQLNNINTSNTFLQSTTVNNMQNAVYKEVEVPDNYPIPIVFIKYVDSETSSNGDRIPIRPASDIYIKNKLIFSKDSSGYAVIKSVRPARNLGKYGYIIIKEGFLPDVTGTLRAVSFGTKINGERCQWAGIISHAMIWNPIGWIVGLKEGTPAVIKSGDTATCKNKIIFSL